MSVKIYELHDQLMQLDRQISHAEEDLEFLRDLRDKQEDTKLTCMYTPYRGTSRMVHLPIPIGMAIEFVEDQLEADREDRTGLRTDLIKALQSLIDNGKAD